MAVELYIAGKSIDLTGNEEIAIDYEIFNPESMADRKGVRSYDFEVPKTTRNRAILENPDGLTNLSNVPYTKLEARLYSNGVDVGVKYCRVKSSKTGYQISMFGGNSGFFDAIRTAKLRDFFFCDLNHRWTRANVAGSRTNTSGYIYPIIDYHADSPNAYIDNTNRELFSYHLFPALFYDDILQRCIAELGYTLNIENPQPDLLIAYSGQPFTRGDQTDYLKVRVSLAADKPAVYNIFHQIGLDYDAITQSCNYWELGYNIYGSQFNFEDVVQITGTLNWEVDNASGAPILAEFWIGSAATVTPEVNDPITIPTGTSTITKQFTVTNAIPDFASLPFYITIRDAADTPFVTIKAGSYIDITAVEMKYKKQILFEPYGSFNGYIVPTALFGDITIPELLKAYCQMFGLIINVNELTKTATLSKFDTVRANNSIYDWSDKLDLSEEVEITFADEAYAKINRFTYTEESGEDKPTGTDGTIEINNEGLNDEETLIELPFAATGVDEMLKKITLNNIGLLEEGKLRNSKELRVLRLNRVDAADLSDTSSLTYKDGTSTTVVSTDIPLTYFNGANGLGFGEKLLADNYVALSEVMARYKKVTALFRLNEADINQLDFTRPVYVSYFNAYFYIAKISEYAPGENESTKVELVKLF